ncbi:hypothetical protein L9F63_003955, partial [Diploptera punctata]
LSQLYLVVCGVRQYSSRHYDYWILIGIFISLQYQRPSSPSSAVFTTVNFFFGR